MPLPDRAKNHGRDDFAQFIAAVIEAVRAELRTAPGLTVKDVAKALRVSEDKVRHSISIGELIATNTSSKLSGKPRWVIAPADLAAFRAKRSSAPLPKVPRRRRKTGEIDFFPDGPAPT